MHSIAANSANKFIQRMKENKRLEGASEDEIQEVDLLKSRLRKADLNVIPNWLAGFNMISAIIILLLLVIGIIRVIGGI